MYQVMLFLLAKIYIWLFPKKTSKIVDAYLDRIIDRCTLPAVNPKIFTQANKDDFDRYDRQVTNQLGTVLDEVFEELAPGKNPTFIYYVLCEEGVIDRLINYVVDVNRSIRNKRMDMYFEAGMKDIREAPMKWMKDRQLAAGQV